MADALGQPPLTDEEAALLRRIMDEGYDFEYTPYMDGFGHRMWRVHDFWDHTLAGAYERAAQEMDAWAESEAKRLIALFRQTGKSEAVFLQHAPEDVIVHYRRLTAEAASNGEP